MNLAKIINSLEVRVAEAVGDVGCKEVSNCERQLCWKKPPTGFIKLNVDSAVSQVSTSIAVMAINEAGGVIKAWARTLPKCEPIEAEAAAIVWALNLAMEEKIPRYCD